jgi:AcrR family transcriptional regulator
MSPRSKEQIQEIRESSKKKILEVSFLLFADQGYHQTSMATIAAKAGISKGLIYNYFDSKEDLLLKLVEGLFKHIGDEYPYAVLDIPPAEMMSRFIRDSVILIERDSQYWRLIYALLLQSDVAKLVKPSIMEFEKQYFPNITKMFKDMNAPYPEEMTLLFHTHLDGLALLTVLTDEHFDSERIIKQLEYLYIPEHLRKK